MRAALMSRKPAPVLVCGALDYDGASDASQFSWRSVAASAAGAGVGQAAGPVIGEAFGNAFGNNAGSAFATRLATSLVAGTATAVMRGGKIAVQQIATDAFGNALGDSLARSSVSEGGGYDDTWRDQNLDRMKVLAGQSLADDYASPNGASGLLPLPQVALGISAVNASMVGADVAVVASAARNGGSANTGPLTPIAGGINSAGQPYYIWNAEGTRSDAITLQGQDGWGVPVTADDIALVAGAFGRSPAIDAAPMAQWNVAELSSPVKPGTTIGQVQAGGIEVRGGPSSLAAQGVKFGRLPEQQLTPFQRELGTFAQDIPKMPGNIAVGVAEAGMNLLWGAIPGSPDYVPYLGMVCRTRSAITVE